VGNSNHQKILRKILGGTTYGIGPKEKTKGLPGPTGNHNTGVRRGENP